MHGPMYVKFIVPMLRTNEQTNLCSPYMPNGVDKDIFAFCLFRFFL